MALPTSNPDPNPEDFLDADPPASSGLRLSNLVAFPLVFSLGWLVQQLPVNFFLRGFHIWIHEFGHSTVAWFSGYQASPLPIGWTNVGLEKSNFVYVGVLFLLAVFFWAGWRERKAWPMIIAAALAPLQFYMTWKLPAYQYDIWMAFSGVGGEFVLSTCFILAFFLDFPEKFKWDLCKYLFLFLGAATFWQAFTLWHDIGAGRESIPWGTLVHGGGDEGGDMNILTQYGWTPYQIVTRYETLGRACLAAIVAAYTFATALFLYQKLVPQSKKS